MRVSNIREQMDTLRRHRPSNPVHRPEGKGPRRSRGNSPKANAGVRPLEQRRTSGGSALLSLSDHRISRCGGTRASVSTIFDITWIRREFHRSSSKMAEEWGFDPKLFAALSRF